MPVGQALRLNKFLAERIGISRRQADDIITSGKVTVDGNVAILGARIDKNSKVCYNNKIIPFENSYTYLALNKPVGYVCSRRQQGDSPTIYKLLPKQYQSLKTVGRLDRDSSGIILLTNDGDFAFQMTHPKFIKEKIYEVKLSSALEPLHQQMIADFGINLPDGKSQLGLEKMDDSRKKWKVYMSEGRNRQIRRTFAAVGYTVVGLHRIQFGKYQLANLPEGKFTEIEK
ncbi:rRNA pseudouridine synthase [Candidatus Saccharibacteria bacterium]|nr:rRNA pseudouridine synthase [Candidatus Saccharibacteria bacterium]